MTNGQDFNGTQRERKAFSCRSGFIVKRKVEYMNVASIAISFLCIFSQALSARWCDVKNYCMIYYSMQYTLHAYVFLYLYLMNLCRGLLKCYKMLQHLHDIHIFIFIFIYSFLKSTTTLESKSKLVNVNCNNKFI